MLREPAGYCLLIDTCIGTGTSCFRGTSRVVKNLDDSRPRAACGARKNARFRARAGSKGNGCCVRDYFSKLVVDERGTRQGFPLDVLSAIMEVARLHAAQHQFRRPICPWEADVHDSKWWNRR
jgi:hypothetical protein